MHPHESGTCIWSIHIQISKTREKPSEKVDENQPATCIGNPFSPLSDASDVQLNPWMEKAIHDGHYTPEQIRILRTQKRKVNDILSSVDGKLEWIPELDTSVVAVGPPAMRPALPIISNLSSNMSPSSSGDATQETSDVFSHGSTNRNSSYSCQSRSLPLFPVPTLNEEKTLLSDVRLVRELGLNAQLPCERRCGRMRLSTQEQEEFQAGNEEYNRSMKEEDEAERSIYFAGVRTEARPASSARNLGNGQESVGFRDSIRHAFRGMLLGRRRESIVREELESRRKDGKRSTKASVKSLRTAPRRPQEDTEESDLGVWEDLDENWALEASRVSLPPTETEHEVMGEGVDAEIHVPGGVALTEEGVDLGAADIIMESQR
ncbi:hypothetical protein MMC09_004136 [Bachmanniomyces sp. S44760]|nr:hypothetical protein [Bachmanniomyces sp. S44760]